MRLGFTVYLYIGYGRISLATLFETLLNVEKIIVLTSIIDATTYGLLPFLGKNLKTETIFLTRRMILLQSYLVLTEHQSSWSKDIIGGTWRIKSTDFVAQS